MDHATPTTFFPASPGYHEPLTYYGLPGLSTPYSELSHLQNAPHTAIPIVNCCCCPSAEVLRMFQYPYPYLMHDINEPEIIARRSDEELQKILRQRHNRPTLTEEPVRDYWVKRDCSTSETSTSRPMAKHTEEEQHWLLRHCGGCDTSIADIGEPGSVFEREGKIICVGCMDQIYSRRLRYISTSAQLASIPHSLLAGLLERSSGDYRPKALLLRRCLGACGGKRVRTPPRRGKLA